jgi:hypothetical protein
VVSSIVQPSALAVTMATMREMPLSATTTPRVTWRARPTVIDRSTGAAAVWSTVSGRRVIRVW